MFGGKVISRGFGNHLSSFKGLGNFHSTQFSAKHSGKDVSASAGPAWRLTVQAADSVGD